MTPKQQATAKAMAQAILAQAEQINRLTDSVLSLHERVLTLEAWRASANQVDVPAGALEAIDRLNRGMEIAATYGADLPSVMPGARV